MLLLEQDTIRKMGIDKFLLVPEFEAIDNKKYKVEAIQDSIIYVKEADRHLLRLYYLIT